MRKIGWMLAWMLTAMGALANDYSVTRYDAMIEPREETEIEITKEVLTIGLTDFDKAKVEVDYTFFNPGERRELEVAFVVPASFWEKSIEFWDDELSDKYKKHPDVIDFEARVNGRLQKVAISNNWEMEDSDMGDSYPRHYHGSYLYSFKAVFEKGENRIQHSYSFLTYGAGEAYWNIEYDLSPAREWKGGVIKDFTLRVSCKGTAKVFGLRCDGLMDYVPKFVEGVGKTVKSRYVKGIDVSMRNAVMEYKIKDFKGLTELQLISGCGHCEEISEELTDEEAEYLYYDRGERMFDEMNYYKIFETNKRLWRNVPYAHMGYVFKDTKLRKFFEKVWWYMPDENYEPKMSDFYEWEREMIMRNK